MNTDSARTCRLEDLMDAKARRDLVRAELAKWVRAQMDLPAEIQALLMADDAATQDLSNVVNERQQNDHENHSSTRLSADFRFGSTGDRRQSGSGVRSEGRRMDDACGEGAAAGA